MYKVKTFFGPLRNNDLAEGMLNIWLAENQDKIEPIGISRSENENGDSRITILYKEK